MTFRSIPDPAFPQVYRVYWVNGGVYTLIGSYELLEDARAKVRDYESAPGNFVMLITKEGETR